MAEMLLITGVPGHGKSLLAITKGLEFVAEGRTVYAAGFKDLDYEATGFLPLPSPMEAFDPSNLDDIKPVPNIKPDWMLLEDAVIIYDECYSVIPTRSPGAKVPVHIDAMARHRHYNIDLIFITQKHGQLDTFIRGLVNQHIHVTRKFGFNGAVLKTWDKFQLDTDRTADRAPMWKYPKKNYALYKSATAHSVKKRIPWFVWAPIPLLAVIGGMIWYVVHNFGKTAPVPVPVAALAAAGGGTGGVIDRENNTLRRSDYAKWMQPRVPGMPWTAPAFDGKTVVAEPRIFCIASDEPDCKCITEQGTVYELELRICQAVARGGSYNPFMKPEQERFQQHEQKRQETHSPGRTPDIAQASISTGGGSGYRDSTLRDSFTPPEQTFNR